MFDFLKEIFPKKIQKVRKKSPQYARHKESSRKIILERLTHYNLHYKQELKSVFIRNQKTRWGSCSNKGNLNFNYKTGLLDQDLCDYVVVHELCHLKEFNHSQKFWDLVGETIPDYKIRRSKLHKIRL